MKIIWGIIGAGDVCEIKSAPALYSTSFSEVKTVMRRNAEKAADFAQRHKIPNWTTDIAELLSDNEIDAIYIATPPASHAEITIKAAKAGKAVYVEKPMANSYKECLTMIDACQQANVPLFVAYYRRTLEGFVKVKELIESGTIGEVRYVNIEMIQPLQSELIANSDTNWRVNPEIAGGGYFHDLASHQLDFLDFLFGPITTAKGISMNQAGVYAADDIVTATFKFESGVLGSGSWCFTSNAISENDSTKIVGSKGELSFNTFGNPMIIHLKTAKYGDEEFSFQHSQPIQKNLIKLIVDELRGINKSPSTGISAARTNKVMDEITKS